MLRVLKTPIQRNIKAMMQETTYRGRQTKMTHPYTQRCLGGKRVKPLSIERVCDWPERAQPTGTQLQRRRV